MASPYGGDDECVLTRCRNLSNQSLSTSCGSDSCTDEDLEDGTLEETWLRSRGITLTSISHTHPDDYPEEPPSTLSKAAPSLDAPLRCPSEPAPNAPGAPGASQESNLETYVNIKKQYFAVEGTRSNPDRSSLDRLVVHTRKPADAVSLTYEELFGPPRWWMTFDEEEQGVSQAKFANFKRISDAFCADMVGKFRRAKPHQGYSDLVEVLRQWKEGRLPGGPAGGERTLLVGTTNIDKLAVQAFKGLAEVHEMHGNIDLVRKHEIKVVQTASPEKRGNFVEKPAIMHFEEDYGRDVPCYNLHDGLERSGYSFSNLIRETQEMYQGHAGSAADELLVIEIGCSSLVRSVPKLRERLLKAGVPVFMVNPGESNVRTKMRLSSVTPTLLPCLGSLKVMRSRFGEFAAALRQELSVGPRSSPA